MSDIQINQREFVRHFSKYLKDGGRYCVSGREGYVVEISKLSDIKVLGNKVSDTKKITPAVIKLISKAGEYGCGCVRVEGKALCIKHGRY